MPMLIINMGGEMIYILEQRLQAQSIPVEKSRKVLTDVIKTMYSPKFIEELFRPQDMYSMQSTRQIFDKLAHASIMRLNQNSMDKLYDLMSMGFKYQTIASNSPTQLLQVTLNHLEAMMRVVTAPAVTTLIERARTLAVDTYSAMSLGEFWSLKQALCRFFQDRRVKVSLFLQDGIQNLDGTIVVSCAGPLPTGTELPGVIRYFDPSGGRVGSDRVSSIEAPDAAPPSTGSALDPATRPCKLGENMYCRDRKSMPQKKPKPGPNSRSKRTDPAPTPADKESKEVDAAPSRGAVDGSASGSAATAGLNMLAGILGVSSGGDRAASSSSGGDNFRLNLFPDDAAGGGGTGSTAMSQVITIDATDRSTLQEMMDKLGFDEDEGADGGGGGGKEAEEGDEDDLLALMDGAK